MRSLLACLPRPLPFSESERSCSHEQHEGDMYSNRSPIKKNGEYGRSDRQQQQQRSRQRQGEKKGLQEGIISPPRFSKRVGFTRKRRGNRGGGFNPVIPSGPFCCLADHHYLFGWG